MNKLSKFILELFGIANIAFGIFIPIAIALTLISLLDISKFTGICLLIIAMMSSMYKAIKIFVK